MAQRIIIPRMGQTMTEGVVAKWCVNDGDSVREGDDIYELEYDKSSAKITAKASGTVRLLCAEGDTVPLGNTVAVILEEGETLDSVKIAGEHEVANSSDKKAVEPPKTEKAVSGDKKAGGEILLASPLARKLVRDAGIDIGSIVPSADDGIIRAADIKALQNRGAVVHDCKQCNRCSPGTLITPLARKLAKEKGIDISLIRPTDGVRIYKKDVLDYVPEKKAGRREKLSGMRKVIAKRMSESYFTYPTVTLNTDADMSDLVKLRKQYNEKFSAKGIKLTINDILVKAVALALRENEVINTSLEGDEIVYHEDINVGIAVALDTGLVVPVVKSADKLSLEEISVETKRLITLARAGDIGGDDMAGGTFSITNLGTAGIDTFNPIINYPQSAILGIGRAVEKPVVRDGNIVIRPIISLSLTHDHRVIDGTPAADFLKTVVGYIENPWILLMD